MSEKDKPAAAPAMITVSANALQAVLLAFVGQTYRLAELRATVRMDGSPVNILVKEYNAWVTEQMNRDENDHILVTRDNLASFKHFHEEAKLHNQASFIFGGQEISTEYAGYVIEHVEGTIKNG